MRLLIPLLFISKMTFGQTGQVRLFDFKSSTCDQQSDPYRLRTRIIKKELSKDILIVEIASIAACCVAFEPKTFVKNGILYLDFEETGNACECTCCYEFIYQVKGIKDKKNENQVQGQRHSINSREIQNLPSDL